MTRFDGARQGAFRIAAIAAAMMAAGLGGAAAQTSDLVNRATLRVCADPADMPLSNEAGEGYENKIAELLSKDLDLPIAYTWFPQATGFYRMTLGIKRCDVVMGFVAAADPVLSTNPYFKSSYVLVKKKGGELDGVDQLSDPRLKGKSIGVIAGTPPADHLNKNGLMSLARPYALMVDRRYDSPAEEMIKDIGSGQIAAGVLWGPIGGYFAKRAGDEYEVTPLIKEQGSPQMSYRITFGIRPDELNWKHQLNDFIVKRQPEINRILLDYGVPLIDERNNPITADK